MPAGQSATEMTQDEIDCTGQRLQSSSRPSRDEPAAGRAEVERAENLWGCTARDLLAKTGYVRAARGHVRMRGELTGKVTHGDPGQELWTSSAV
jgi:hypothetical protein